MKKLILGMILLPLFLCAQTAAAETHRSELGYTMNIPNGWVSLSNEDVRGKPEVVEAALQAAKKTEGLTAWPDRISAQLKSMLEGGNMDYYYSPDPRFTISVYKAGTNIPRSANELRDVCMNLSNELSEQAEKKVQVHCCELRILNGNVALHIVADDYWKGHKYIQSLLSKLAGDSNSTP
ncbi:hypothetical protein [Desulfatiglans anilini]|uniref:hypothetical protein n=1 Tax=Desulfatiglans anilini TaxID=90728 RepID=UPI00040A92F4|nr:hypothetical protein [Desulfatiglans anilini]